MSSAWSADKWVAVAVAALADIVTPAPLTSIFPCPAAAAARIWLTKFFAEFASIMIAVVTLDVGVAVEVADDVEAVEFSIIELANCWFFRASMIPFILHTIVACDGVFVRVMPEVFAPSLFDSRVLSNFIRFETCSTISSPSPFSARAAAGILPLWRNWLKHAKLYHTLCENMVFI